MGYRDRPGMTTDLAQRLWLALVLVGGGMLGVLLLRVVLPWLFLAGLMGTGGWLWRRQQQHQKRLYRLFYDLLKSQGGQISALDFAMAAQLTGQEARTFLDARAREFYASFDPTDQGDILYTFISRQGWESRLTADPNGEGG